MNLLQLDTNRYFLLVKLFIILQPIFDMVTFFMLDMLGANITFGILIRMVFMLISLTYIFFGNENPYKGIILTYIISLLFVLGTSLIINYFYKPTFIFISEVQWVTKISYFTVMLVSLFLLLTSTKAKGTSHDIIKATYIAMFILSISILVSVITNTSSNTYEWVLYGYKGWFFSGNEIGAIISITFPLITLYSIKKTKTIRDYKYWMPTLLVAIIGFFLGTKVGFLSVSLTLLLTSLILIIKMLRKQVSVRYSGIFIGATILIVIVISPFSPGIQNFSVDMPIPEKDKIIEEPDLTDENPLPDYDEDENTDTNNNSTEDEVRELPGVLDSKIVNKVLSSRHFYFTRQYFQFTEANILQKLFGMGYSGNYVNTMKTIEMDILDVFFSFGIVGSSLIFMPFLIGIFFIAKLIFTSFDFFYKIDNILLLISMSLGIGVSIIAGHVMFAPAVSLYFSIPIAILLVESIRKLQEIK